MEDKLKKRGECEAKPRRGSEAEEWRGRRAGGSRKFVGERTETK